MSDGKGCQCAAYSSSDCGCPNVDWTPQEIYDLREKVKALDQKLSVALKDAERYKQTLESVVVKYKGGEYKTAKLDEMKNEKLRVIIEELNKAEAMLEPYLIDKPYRSFLFGEARRSYWNVSSANKLLKEYKALDGE